MPALSLSVPMALLVWLLVKTSTYASVQQDDGDHFVRKVSLV